MILKFKPQTHTIQKFIEITKLDCEVDKLYDYESSLLPKWLKVKAEYICKECNITTLISYPSLLLNIDKNDGYICKRCVTIKNNKVIIRKGITHTNSKIDYKKIAYDKFGIILSDGVIKERSLVTFECIKHGKKTKLLKDVLRTGCLECNIEKYRSDKLKKFIEKSNIVHNNKYNYDKVEYLNNKKKVIIVCEKHGEFKQIPNAHLTGSGCTYCNYKLTNEDFIEKCNKIHNNKFIYDKVIYNGSDNYIKIFCEKHGYFEQLAKIHIAGFGCSICRESIGESKIRDILDSKNIEYITQHKFDKCRNKYKLPFDFFIPKLNICIEYNGIQHYEPVEFFGGQTALDYRINNDKIKEDFCLDNKINLIIISHKDKIEDMLLNIFNNNC